MIAEKQDDELWLSDCGYQTKTTKSRLNCILSHFNLPKLHSKEKQWYVGEKVWSGHDFFEIEETEEDEKSIEFWYNA